MNSPAPKAPDLEDCFHRVWKRLSARLKRKQAKKAGTSSTVIAVSGGADSMALALLFAQWPHQAWGQPWGWHLAFVQHHLRGSESLRDEAFVCDSHRLWQTFPNPPQSIVVLQGVPPGGWRVGAFEGPARTIRYQALQEFGQDLGAGAIVTAHTLDDQAETVLLRLMRGAGMSGLGSIHPLVNPKIGSENLPIVRPLLNHRRDDLRQWLTEQKVPWMEDTSNQLLDSDRNYLRHLVLDPLVRRWGARAGRFLARLANQSRVLQHEMARKTDQLIGEMELPRAGKRVVWQLAKAKIKRNDELANCLYRLWQREGWPAREWSAVRFRRLARFIRGRGPLEDLPAGWRVHLDCYVVRFDPPAEWNCKVGFLEQA